MLPEALRKIVLQSLLCSSSPLSSFLRVLPAASVLFSDWTMFLSYSTRHCEIIFTKDGWYSATVCSVSGKILHQKTLDDGCLKSWGYIFITDLKINIKDAIFQQEFARGKYGWILHTCQWCLGIWYFSMGTLPILPTRRKQPTIFNSIFLAWQRSGKFHYSSVCFVLSYGIYTSNAKI